MNTPKKNPAAVALGKLGGKARKLTTEEARRIQALGAAKRRAKKAAKYASKYKPLKK